MNATEQPTRRLGQLRQLPVSWISVGLFAVLISYANGFWITTVQETVGSIERLQSSFGRWLRDSTLMLPVIFLAVVAALALAHRIAANSRWKLLISALLIVGITTTVSMAEVGISAAYDYRLQSNYLTSKHSSHLVGAAKSAAEQAAKTGITPKCSTLCTQERRTLMAHLRAARYAAIAMTISNVIIVGWALAIRGGKLWIRPSARRKKTAVQINHPASGTALA
ncbi:MAG: hypothetical protein WCK14_14250 [Actinomycetota bacterium]|jgi:hypothetical protein